jgi:hypothetical protein
MSCFQQDIVAPFEDGVMGFRTSVVASLKDRFGLRPALKRGRVKVRSSLDNRCSPDAVAGSELQGANQNSWETALWSELASHTLPDPVFWEAEPNQSSS